MKRRRPAVAGVLISVALAAVIACGGTSTPTVSPTAGAAPPPQGPPRAELDDLVRRLAADAAALGLPAPEAPLDACIQPPCAPDRLALSVAPRADDPACRPGPSEVCTSSCKLSDSICDSATRICRIAGELGGNDAYANEKCAAGKTSCAAARVRCCGCGPA